MLFKLVALSFTSTNGEINRPLSCKAGDTFAKIEEKIYNEYPKYKDYNTYLRDNGNLVKRFNNIEENKIKDGNIIIINIYEE